jgi:tRNA 2-thiouridine synthesizing protein D
MKFSLLVLNSPHASQAGDSAWQFARAAVAEGHSVYRVFFYHEGVYHGSELGVCPQDEQNRVLRWAEFAYSNDTSLVLCISSAVKRGLLDASEANRHDKLATSMHPAFALAGLGELIDASAHSDRLLSFGG